jgi:hypothetical protein
MTCFVHHRITVAPRQGAAVAAALAARGGALYGLWRSQIGRPRDEITAMTAWPDTVDPAAAGRALAGETPGVAAIASEAMLPTLRPADATPPRRQGNYAFRWFVTPEAHWEEFLALCAAAWPGFEAAYDSQVIGLWTAAGPGDAASGEGGPGQVRSLLLTRRPDLAMWERSKLPQGAAETAVRDALSRRYDLCDWTAVSTATLLTATDAEDTARWA